MEDLMYYVWQQRMFVSLQTIDGSDIEVLNPGLRNLDAGPDFFNAKVRIDGTTWAGNVEMHVKASDWYRHHHQNDKNYDSVILHVVMLADTEITLSDGEKVKTVVMHIPPQVMERYHSLTAPEAEASSAPSALLQTQIPCSPSLATLPAIILHDWQTALATSRMLSKVQRVRDLIDDQKESWPAAFYIILARSFGTGVNSDACERLARSLPFAYLQKHIDSLLQTEALLLGQAGWLQQPHGEEEVHYGELRREYLFLAAKFNLTPLPPSVWKFARMRPQASPQLRIAVLAALLHTRRNLFDDLMSAQNLDQMVRLLSVRVEGWWKTHYSLHPDPSPEINKGLGMATIRSLIINAVIPIMLAYGQWQGDDEQCQRALSLLESIAAEDNRYTRLWLQAGIPMRSALDTQAMLHLYHEYCEHRMCMRCRIGCWLVKHGA